MRQHIIKVGLGLTIIGTSSSVVAVQQSSSERSGLSSLGIVRFGRAALSVAIITADYKYTLRGLSPACAEYQQVMSKVHQRSAERLLSMCWKNGGCFIKVGQHIGALDYLVPREYSDTMKVLHRCAPETDFEEIQQVIREDLRHSCDELFSSFSVKPLASASLAQVHKATRRKDDETVAVKVQHPRVKAHAAVDMATMELLVAVVSRVFPDFEFKWLAEETRKNLPLELDFVHEAENCEKVAERFSHLGFLKVPAIDRSLTSERVLTMEFCEGGLITDSKYMQANGIPRDEVLDKLGRLYSEMIFVQGYIHCDPHPGNILTRKTPSGVQLVLLDHGLYQNLPDDIRVNYCRLWQSILRANVDDIKTHSSSLGIERLHALFACIVTGRSWQAIQHGVNKEVRSTAETAELRQGAADFLPQIISVLNTVPRELLLIFKTNDLLRGIESSLRGASSGQSSSLTAHCRHYAETAFLSMARCCVEALYAHLSAECGQSKTCRWKCSARKHWLLLKLSLYETYLRLSEFVRRQMSRFTKSEEMLAPDIPDAGDDTVLE